MSVTLESSAPLLETDRISTGNAQADYILDGGFPAHSINVVMGQPGTGKTIFVEQMLFHNASADRPVMYLTTLSEPFHKVITYLQRFTFFDEAKFGTSVLYEDVGYDLVEVGVDALREKLHAAVLEYQPRIIVIDSFKAVHDLVGSQEQARRWMVDLAGVLSASDTTTFLVGEYSPEQIARYPEFAIADGIIEFARKPRSNRDERFMRVSKLRGSSYIEGLHGLRITSAGLDFFPRLVESRTVQRDSPQERISTGIEGVDQMLNGGLWRGTSTLLVGAAGSGKTTIGLQFIIDGVLRGEPGLFLNFQESPRQLARVIRGLGHDPAELQRRGLHLKYFSPVELHIDSIVADLFRTVHDAKISRLAVDAIGDLVAAASDPDRLHDYLYALMQHMSGAGVSSMMMFETHEAARDELTSGERLSYMSDCIIRLRLHMNDRTASRTLRILKARSTNHDLDARPFTITAKGLVLS